MYRMLFKIAFSKWKCLINMSTLDACIFFLHLARYTQWKNGPLPPRDLKNLPVGQENQMERGRWNSKKKTWKGILGQGKLCPIVLFCSVYINFSNSSFCFQEILMLNVIIYRWSFISFHASSFSGKVYNGKRCCTPFEILLLQTSFPLPILMEV